jgi:riboflavin synthase
MFTGIIQALGTVVRLDGSERECTLQIDHALAVACPIAVGDSIAVNGVCLTVCAVDASTLLFDVSGETLLRSNLGGLTTGRQVNLETALSAQSLFGGHLVSGHVDGMATVVSAKNIARSQWAEFEMDRSLASYLAPKGSVAIDGVSLTINEVYDYEDGVRIGVNLVPHTLSATTLGRLQCGDRSNVEIDLVARYLARQKEVEKISENLTFFPSRSTGDKST